MIIIHKKLGRLYFIQAFAVPTVWLGMYIPGIDVLLAIVYILIIFAEGKSSMDSLGSSRVFVLALLWQMPGFLLAALFLLTQSLYFVVMLELWATPLIPFISLLPKFLALSGIAYYQVFFAALLVMIFFFVIPFMLYKWGNK